MSGKRVHRTQHQTLLLILLAVGAGGLKDVRVSVPEAVESGATVTMYCRYNLENDTLYSVKWYKGRREFFRYIPKELPHTRVFPLQGVAVDVGRSGAGSLVLRSVTPSLSGRYRCEVSADAPSFHTAMKTSYMQVVEVPVGPPELVAERTRVAAGVTLRARCTAPSSLPPANLTWLLNGHLVNGTSLELLPIEPSFYKRSLRTSLDENTIQPLQPSNNISSENQMLTYDVANAKDGFITAMNESGQTRHDNGLSQEAQWNEGLYEQGSGGEEPRIRRKSMSTLTLVVKQESLRQGTLKLTCKASIYNLYNAQAELLLAAEKPQIASVLVLATGHTHSGTKRATSDHLTALLCILLMCLILR